MKERVYIVYLHPDYWFIRKEVLAELRKFPFVKVRANLKVSKTRMYFELRFSEFNNYCASALLLLGKYLGQNGYTKHFTDESSVLS